MRHRRRPHVGDAEGRCGNRPCQELPYPRRVEPITSRKAHDGGVVSHRSLAASAAASKFSRKRRCRASSAFVISKAITTCVGESPMIIGLALGSSPGGMWTGMSPPPHQDDEVRHPVAHQRADHVRRQLQVGLQVRLVGKDQAVAARMQSVGERPQVADG